MENFAYRKGRTPPRIISELNGKPEVCLHNYSIKADQTHTQEPLDGHPAHPIKQAAGICQKCLVHIEVSILSSEIIAKRCPNEEHPLHFFVSTQPAQHDPTTGKDTHTFRCKGCEAALEISSRPPRINPSYFDLLINEHNLQQRYERASRLHPNRAGLEQQKGIKVLDALISYLNEALVPIRDIREIPADNKRFMTSFGEDCEPFLEWLRFAKKPLVVEDNRLVQFEAWVLPSPPPRDPFVDGHRRLLEDVREEILAMIRHYPEREIATLRSPPPKLEPLKPILSKILDSERYPVISQRLRRLDLSGDDWYADLGATSDFADDLLLYCFKQQCETIPEKTAYLFDTLTAIGKRRDTDDMQMALAMLASEGYVSEADTIDAYAYLGFQMHEIALLDDETILRSFNVRLESSPKHQESQLRQNLKILGKTRGSALLTSAAENDFRTADQALKWLDPAYTGSVHVSDDAIIALAASKKGDSPDQLDLVKKAVGLLATERNSEMLRIWIREGTSIGDMREEQLSAAYRFFGIADRTSEVDFDVLAIYLADYADDAAKSAEAAKHYKIIYDLKHNTQEGDDVDYYNRPVGLENMGNTCYLNCLLQFLYVVKPLRDIIDDFDQHKVDTDEASFEPKRVDNITIPRIETIEAQKFVTELRGLFKDMAGNSRPTVRPTWDLAKLALRRTTTSGSARRSTIGGDLPVLKSPLRQNAPSFPSSSITPSKAPYNKTANSSEITLIDSAPKTPEDDQDLMVIEKDVDGKEAIRSDSPVDIEIDAMDPEAVPLLPPANDEPPSRPPPVPPRPIGPLNKPISYKDESSKREAEEAARQQDVVESMGYALDKIQYSIKNEITLSDGKYTDIVHQLFYGESIWRYINSKVPDMVETFSTINVTLSQKPKSISVGLDDALSVEEVDFEGKTAKRFRTITQPPPIFQISFQRQEFDHIRGDAVVLKHHIQLEETIYLDRFITHEDEELHKLREKSWEFDTRLNKLKTRKQQLLNTKSALEAPELLDATWEFVSKHPDLMDESDPDLLDDLEHERNARKAEVAAVKSRIDTLDSRRTDLFSQHKKYGYKLAAVFVHRGQGGSVGGHYWIYIFDFKVSKWRRYEDRDVREVTNPEEEIFKAKDPEVEGAPYFVVYIKEDSTDDIVDALWRIKPEEIQEEPTQEAASDAIVEENEAAMEA